VLEYEIIKDAGPLGIGLFAGYLFLKEIIKAVRKKNGNGVGLTNQLLNQDIYKTVVDLKSEAEKQTRLLEKIADKLT
jgi:hypothetical protein